VSRGHRLQKLERTLDQASSTSICFECAGLARPYRMEIDLARLFAVAEGKAWPWEGSPEEGATKLREMADSAEPDHCRTCGELTTIGLVREHLRRAGTLAVPGVKLSQRPTDRTIGADLEFLRRVCNWALTVTRGNGKPLLEHHVLTRYAIPTNANPRRPVATYDRYLAIRAHADEVDRQRLFGAFLDLVEGLGWRVTAICELRATDVDLTVSDARPYGRLRKRAETDKMGVGQWVPMSAGVRSAVLAALERNAAIGEAPLFPAPAREGPWTRYHARDLLERAEKAARAAALKRDDADAAASLAPLEGSDFHAYRRAWATARKHLPLKDVAEAGGWRSTDTLLRCYTQVDEVTMFQVVSETRKVRAAGKQLEH
jgi:hypothetical protein